MKVSEIRELVKIVEESEVADLEFSKWGQKVRISKYGGVPFNHTSASHFILPQMHSPAMMPMANAAPSAPPAPAAPQAIAQNLFEIKSPMVGTFYRSPAPDAEPYVSEGDIVAKGQALCIIEAMKLMNEIESDLACRIVEVLVENSQPVEYNQPLFRVEKT